jgi:predicted RNase H-like nuclease
VSLGALQSRSCIGIDGCRGGWVWCGNLDGRWQGGLVERLALLDRLDDLELALIDMPIGLVDAAGPERHCDRAARALLGRPRASSVFRPPCRAAMAAPDYSNACAINRSVTGVALSMQTWNITAKIRELDALLASRHGLSRQLREAHPELCLWGLAGGRPMRHGKRTRPGRLERLALLREIEPDCVWLVDALADTHPRRRLAVDDIIDALVLAVTASEVLRGGAQYLPSEPELDPTGLPMQLVFARR